MEDRDYLNQRTTNINIRISPMVKTKLIEQGARQGLNLSDYIMHVLTVEMSGGNRREDLDITENEEYQDLLEDYNDACNEKEAALTTNLELQKQLKGYEDLTKNFSEYVGQTIVIDTEKIEVNTPLDILKIIVKCVQIN